MRILVTGGAGFIGGALVAALAERGDEVTAFDLAETPAIAALRQRMTNVGFVAGELTEWPQLAETVKRHRPEAVIHCAAVVGIVNSLASPAWTMRVNIEGSLNVLSAMKLFDVPLVINISSEEIYGPFRHDIIDEMHPCFPSQPYGISKFAVEQLGRDFAATHGMSVVNIRTCSVYGPGFRRPRFPKTLIDAALAGRPLHMPNGTDYRVDQTYIDDLVDGLLLALDHRDHAHDAYHVASGEAPTLGEMVEMIRELIPGAELSIGPGDYEATPGHPAVRKGALDCGRARLAFGYRPCFPLRAGLAATIEAQRRSVSY